MSDHIKLSLHRAKSIAMLAARIRKRNINNARDFDFLVDLLEGAEIRENHEEGMNGQQYPNNS